ncbi:MAG: hypothetical protein JXA30_16910 [Deltaproteobacteria bacterium]|nr:hypothetical protein [Deltaproteobacteria bacterium]
MRYEALLRLFGQSSLMLSIACGNITHDIGKVYTETQKNDASVSNSDSHPVDAALLRDRRVSSVDSEAAFTPRDSSIDERLLDGESYGDTDLVEIDETDSGLDRDGSNESCIEERIEVDVKTLGLDIYVMMDAFLFTGFWSPVLTSDQQNLWLQIRQEIAGFVDDPESAGIGLGIQYYGKVDIDVGAPRPVSCEASTYAKPAVPIAQLPGNANRVKVSFPLTPFSGSPVVPALEGAIEYAKSRVSTYSDRKQVVFLITGTSGLFDFICGSTIEILNSVAEQGYKGSPSITSYFVGIYPGDLNFPPIGDFLREAALLGGTSQPYLASIGGSEPGLEQRLSEARDSATLSACRLDLPSRYRGGFAQPLDLDLVSLVYQTPENETVEIPYVFDHSFCSSGQEGWYFDDPIDPNQIIACEESCKTLNSLLVSQVELRIVCPS